MSQLSTNINARRIELGLTYEQVWDALQNYPWPVGIKPPSLAVVGHWFNGRRRPRQMVHLQGLVAVLGLSLDEAIQGAPHEAATGVEQAILVGVRGLPDADAEMVLAMIQHLKSNRLTTP